MTSTCRSIRVLGNRVLFAPFSENQDQSHSGIIIPHHLRPAAVEGIVVALGTPRRGRKPKQSPGSRESESSRTQAITEGEWRPLAGSSTARGERLRHEASKLLAHLQVGDRVRIDNTFGHHAVTLIDKKRGDLQCQIRSVLDILFVYPRR